MTTFPKKMPSAEKLLKKHARTIQSPALKAIREWREPQLVFARDETSVCKTI